MHIPVSKLLFQFHEGPIKTAESTPNQISRTSFNSMKVRLKLNKPTIMNQCFFMFQFHEGPIKTETTKKKLSMSKVSIP